MMLTVFDLALKIQQYQLSLGDYAPIRAAYRYDIESILTQYLTMADVRLTRFRNWMKKAIVEAFPDAFAQGFMDGGGGQYPGDAEAGDIDWLVGKETAEFGHVDELFYRLRDLKPEGQAEWGNEPSDRAEGYANGLDAVYKEGKMRGAKSKMLTFGGLDGQESCKDCQRLKSARHKASWWVKHGLIPGQKGNRNYECGGWMCEHFLYDDNGQLFIF